MDTIGMSIKMMESNKWKSSEKEMREAFISLKEQLKFVKRIVRNNKILRSKGYEQYRTYSNNKRRDKMTTIVTTISEYHFSTLIGEIDTFFKWEEEFRQQQEERRKKCTK